MSKADMIKVAVTIDGFTESFWVTPTGEKIGTVANLLLVGVISLDDTITWNDALQVTSLVKRSGRVNLMLRPVVDKEDLAGKAKWSQALDDALPAFREHNIRYEGGLETLMLSVTDDALASLTSEDIPEDKVQKWLGLIPGDDWNIEYAVGSAGGDPIDNTFLELEVPEVEPRKLTVPEDAMTDTMWAAMEAIDGPEGKALYQRLVEGGHINTAVAFDDLMEEAVIAILHDPRAMKAWRSGHLDQVLVLAGRFAARERGLMLPQLDSYLFGTTFAKEN